MGHWILSLLFLGFVGTLEAKEKFAYAPQKLSLKDVRSIKISGVKGNLKLKGHKSTRHLILKVQHSKGRRLEDWHLSAERRGSVLFLEVFNVAYGKQWKNLVREDQWPEFDIEIEAPALPMDVSWREGRIEIASWSGDLDLSLLKGSVMARSSIGTLNLHPVAADVSITNHLGAVSIRGESGDLQIRQVVGDINVNWLSGDLSFRNCRGKLRVETRSGHAVVAGLEGTLEAKGHSTQWDLTAAAPADVNIESITGPVNLLWSHGGAKVFLASQRGKIAYPVRNFLKSSDREGTRVVEGVKPGANKKMMGQVFVRSEAGTITWR